ncbi:immune inhibitor A domain-containing protein [Shewanella morhuae]|uniref:immune inhibitor A domain-containing protein n=1 Tax=Shewanella morhuae TaxID=365591 RepID=UPI001BBD2DB1|nr:immune inhibitor A domain-containing protein [Shewanella morhuae]GIU07055.1 peptidase M6 [Shewanella morhuae]
MRSTKSAIAFGLLLALISGAGMAASNHTPADAGVINKDRILYWLIKRGEVATDASDSVKQAAIEAYIYRATLAQPKTPRIEVEAEHARVQRAQSSHMMRSPAQRLQVDADVKKTVKVLTVLIDFPNLKHDNNGLKADDTAMYYPSYPLSHYQNLLFSKTGFNGPQGQNLTSGYQYYQAVSGQTFSFTGEVKGWYTANQNAEYYGANDPQSGSDAQVSQLVKEAVSQAVASMSIAELASYDVEDPYDINNNGNYNEPDGIIDHVMIFHSSIGEETGGGALGTSAIWSHRYFVDQGTQGYALPGTVKKVFGYTIQPIDAATGVCTHEFGHDLGLPDEYDTSDNTSKDGSPVGAWSLMSGGSWTGDIAGAQPSGFSPYARSYLQERYKGKWLNEREISLDSIPKSGINITLNEAVNHQAVNQISIPLPPAPIPFKMPYQGSYQYYSGQGNMLNNSMSFNLDLPKVTTEKLILSMQASWSIETDYDYMQVNVNGVAIAGNHTLSDNAINNARHIITGESSVNSQAEGSDAWVALEYDLTAFAGNAVTIEINYVTDEATTLAGITLDSISIKQNTTELYSDNAEVADKVKLNGYSRIQDSRPGAASRYLIQLRSHNGVDVGLKSVGFDPGVLLWLEDVGYTDNNVSDHAGHSLIGVIDADQNMLGVGLTSTDEQIRDAAFSTVKQSFYLGDNHLDAVSLFDDSLDYSAPLQPQSGMVLQPLGLTMQVLSQSRNNSTAVIRLANANAITPLTVSFTKQVTQLAVNFTSNVDGGMGQLTYAWRFGDGATSTAEAPTHTYAAAGAYSVELTVTDMANTQVTSNATVTVAAATESSGGGSLAWLNLAILGVFAWSRQLKWR